jgi:lysophospholipase L1-like esterase
VLKNELTTSKSRTKIARYALRWGSHLLLTVATLCLFFICLELILRLVGREILSTSVLVAHPQIGATWRPYRKGKVSTLEAPTPISINSLGLRDREYGPKPANIRRVLVLGDSVAGGYAVRQEETFAKVAEQLLNEHKTHPSWEIVNGGVPGHSTEQEFELLRTIGWNLDPDVIVVAFNLETDVFDNFRDRGPEPWYPRPQDATIPVARDKWRIRLPRTVENWLLMHSACYVWFQNRYDKLLLGLGVRAPIPRYESPPWTGLCAKGAYERSAQIAWRLTRNWIAEIRRETTEHGAQLVVLIFPFLVQVDHDALRHDLRRFALRLDDYDMLSPNAEIASILKELGIPFHDLTQTLKTHQDIGESTFFKVNSHLTPAGHRIAAEALADMLRAMDPRTQ